MTNLRRPTRRLHEGDRQQWAETRAVINVEFEDVTRLNDSQIDLTSLDSLLATVTARIANDEWADRARSDSWIAPRLHSALRISRVLASDRSIWEWLASTSWQDYVRWRWADASGSVADNRWFGPINKQALARLWWGGELLRDGSDYTPVVQAFEFQDFPNSFLHRPLVRCRSFGLGILEALFDGDVQRSAADVNSLASKLNLSTAGTPPEAMTDFQVDDRPAFDEWASRDGVVTESWEVLPSGPAAEDVTERSRHGGRSLAEHGLDLAGLDRQSKPPTS